MMNERIKELVVESGNGQMRNGKLYPHIGSRTEEDWKKFAELIVRECAVPMIIMAREMDTNSCKNNPVEVNAMALHQGLMKHFGVEQ